MGSMKILSVAIGVYQIERGLGDVERCERLVFVLGRRQCGLVAIVVHLREREPLRAVHELRENRIRLAGRLGLFRDGHWSKCWTEKRR
jgi:hypothetical protein